MSDARTFVTLVRHGETDWNRQRRIQGSSDIPLNDTGRTQARAAGDRLVASRWDAIAASPLVRAFETATIIADAIGLGAVDPIAAFVERRHGVIEGLTESERAERFPPGSIIDGLESDEDVVERVVPALVDSAAGRPGEALLIVTHGGVIGSLLRHLSGGTLPAPDNRIGNGSAHDFVVENGRVRIGRS